MFYEPLELEPVSVNISDMLLLTTPLPSGGPQLLFILNLLSLILKDGKLTDNGQTAHHLTEVWKWVWFKHYYLSLSLPLKSFKYSFSLRSLLGDPWCDKYCDKDSLIGLQNNRLIK